jgi:predicted DsbA family dithiol-disulfide isomerase
VAGAVAILGVSFGENQMSTSVSESEPVVTVEMVSDVVCPWCFIGKRRLEKALALKPENLVNIRYRPYFLNPWVPRHGMSRNEYLTAKFGSVERYKANAGRIGLAAQEEGLAYNPDAITRQPNTLDCHRLILWAAETADAAGSMKQRLMELYFSEGADLTDNDVLVRAAHDCGMNADEVRRRLAGEADVERVSAEAEAARNAGIDGVPCFVIAAKYAVSGAQAPDVLAGAIERAVAERTHAAAASTQAARLPPLLGRQ